MAKIMYVGRHNIFQDKTYGTDLVFEKDKTIYELDAYIANKFLKHEDSFIRVPDDAPAVNAVQKVQFKLDKDEKERQIAIKEELLQNAIKAMDKPALERFVFTNFSGYKFDNKMTSAEMKDVAINLLNRFRTPSIDEDEKVLPKGKLRIKTKTLRTKKPEKVSNNVIKDLYDKGYTADEIKDFSGASEEKIKKVIIAYKNAKYTKEYMRKKRAKEKAQKDSEVKKVAEENEEKKQEG